MAAFEPLSGMAGEIRSATESEQYDLAGYTEARVKDLIVSAFSAPLTAPTHMIRCTFVVGGGKLVRSRYPEDLTKWMVAALREIGFTEDRSAAETLDSQGTYKQQHDTGQNLKYCIVFPRIAESSLSSSSAAKAAGASDGASADGVSKSSPEHLVTVCDLVLLQEMVGSKILSWQQKKRLLKVLQESRDKFKQIEAKLVSGAQLTPAEQEFYDSNSGVDDEKISWLQGEIKKMVDSGRITSAEKTEILDQLTKNIASVQDEIDKATAASEAAKKIEKLNEKKAAIVERKAVVTACSPIAYRLKHSEDIQKLQLQVCALLTLEDKGRSCSLTLADLKQLEAKSDLEAQIVSLQNSSRGWFITQEEFQAMADADINEAKAKYAARQKKQSSGQPGKKPATTLGSGGGAKTSSASRPSSSSSSSASSNGMSWSSIGVKKAPPGGSAAKKASSGGAVKNSFAAFGGDDSDEDN